jgi:hypothetical protein
MSKVMNKVMYCNKCDFVEISNVRKICPEDKNRLTDMGFIELAKKYNTGGTLIRKTCGCGRPTEIKDHDALGRPKYRSQCTRCREAARKYPTDKCEGCGLLNDGTGNIDRDHIDGNRSNNDFSNLQALCKECHKVKTRANGDVPWRFKG